MRHSTIVSILAGLAWACAWVSGVAAVTAGEIAPITQLKPLYLDTALAVDGRARCAIVAPDDPAYRPLAQKLAQAVQQACGVAPPIRSPAEVVRNMPPRENLIALGLFANNPLVEDLYLREFVLCDYAWPGGACSYVIRTVHNPWLNGQNVVYLGSASLAGCQAAVERFAQRLGQSRHGSLGPIIEVSKDGQSPQAPEETDEKIAARTLAQIEKAVSQDSAYKFAAHAANAYFLSGHPVWARLFLASLRKIDQLHRSQPDVASPSACQYIFQWFDCIEEGPAFSDQDRLEATNLLYQFAARLPEAQKDLKPLVRSAGNHGMASAMAALYFSRYYPDLELSKRLLANARTFYEPDMKAWKPPEDSPRYANITVVRSFRWALQCPDRRYIDQGRLKRIADYYMLISNNLGQLSGIGDFVGLGHPCDLVESYPLAAWLYRDGRLLWWWDHFAKEPTALGSGFHRHRGQGLMGWVPPDVLPRKRPDDLLGISLAPLDQWIYDRRDIASFLGRPYEDTRRFPIEQCYDKVAFRAGFDPSDQYLCLSGFGWGYHSHAHANAIVNYTDQGQTRLYDDGYMVAQPSEHNTVIVLKEGWMGGIPELAQVRAQADFPQVGLFVSRLNDYSGVDWDRAILWSKSRWFLVIDALQAQQAGNYTFQGIWRTLGTAQLRARRWESIATDANPPGSFHLLACSDARLAPKPSAGTNLNAPPFPLDKARRLVQSASQRMQPGDRYTLANLLYTTPDAGRSSQLNVARLDNTAAYLVDDGGQLLLAGVGPCDALPGLRLDATAFLLSTTTLTAAGARRIHLGTSLLAADAPINVELDLRTGEARVKLTSAAQLTWTASQQAEKIQRLTPGAHTVQLRPVAASSLSALAQAMQTAFARLSQPAAQAETAVAQTGSAIRRLWQYRAASSKPPAAVALTSPHPNALRVADLDADGREEILVAGADNAVHALGADGRRLWRHPLPDTILDLNVTPAAARPRQIVVGCDDNRVHVLQADGSLAWSAAPPPRSYARPGYREGDLAVHQGKPVVVFAADLQADGRPTVIVGVSNGFVYAFDPAGKLLWDAISHTPHSMTCGAACDLDGDHRQEIVMGNIYGYAQIFSADGKRFGQSCGTGHAGAVVVASADIEIGRAHV